LTDLPSPDSLVRQAEIFRQAGEHEKAIKLLEQALAAAPEHLDAQIQLGAIYIDLGRTGQARELLKGAVRRAPSSAVVRRLMALVHLMTGDLFNAKHEAEAAVRLGPNDGYNHTVLGRVLERRKSWAAAEASLRRGAELAPHAPYALVHLGYFLIRRRKFAAAALVAEDAGRAAPDDFGVLLLRGNTALQQGRADEARDFALWALSQRPSNREAIKLLVSVKTRQSWWLGLWWRMNASFWLRLLVVAASVPLNLWLVTLIYLVAGRFIFERMVASELKTVKLKAF
jgi:Tfp pilus assembly protein PilF